MRGRGYLRHTVYHTVDNANRNKALNNNYKKATKDNAIYYLRNNSNLSVAEKKSYLLKLTTDNYRYGRKYKYKCNLSYSDLADIIAAVGDNELHQAIFNKTIQEYKDSNTNIAIILFVVSIIIILIKVLSSLS